MADISNTLKSCDTIPAPQNLAVRVGSRQRHQSFSASTDSDDLSERPWTGTIVTASSSASASSTGASVPGRTSGGEGTSTTGATASLSFLPAGKIVAPSPVPPPRHLCMRHTRTADEGTNRQLQKVRCLPQTCSLAWDRFLPPCYPNRQLTDYIFFLPNNCRCHSNHVHVVTGRIANR